jgi:hypothetical protein
VSRLRGQRLAAGRTGREHVRGRRLDGPEITGDDLLKTAIADLPLQRVQRAGHRAGWMPVHDGRRLAGCAPVGDGAGLALGLVARPARAAPLP